MNALQRIARWVADAPRGRGAEAELRVRRALLDSLAVALAGRDTHQATAVRQTIEKGGSGACTMLGLSERCNELSAALANGTAMHSQDFDDYEDPGATHISAVLVPALLAAGEAEGASGADFIDAYVAGFEVAVRVGQGVNLSHYRLGWHATATIGRLAAAAAVARLLRLETRAVASAISIATSMAGGYCAQIGADAKALHAGLAAQSGIQAARLAAAGIEASDDVLDGTWSFLTLQGGKDAPGYQGLAERLQGPLAIETFGITVKPYPCCGFNLCVIDAAIELASRHRFTADEIEAVEVVMPAHQAAVSLYEAPQTPSQARFSAPYCAAVALLRGSVGPEDFTEAAGQDPDLRALLARVSLAPLPASATRLDQYEVGPVEMTLRTADGRDFASRVVNPKGAPQRPMSDREISDKFAACAAGTMAADSIAAAEKSVGRLEALPSLSTITGHFRASAPTLAETA